MSKLKSEDLAEIRRETYKEIKVREGKGRVTLTVHTGECGIKAGARNIMGAVLSEINTRKLDDVLVINSGCAGLCSQEPMITVQVMNESAPVKYVLLTPEKIKRIFDSHIMNGAITKEYALAMGSEKNN